MNEQIKKYIEITLKGYTEDYRNIKMTIDQLELQIKDYKKQMEEFSTGMSEMRKILKSFK